MARDAEFPLVPEPYRVKVVEPIRAPSREDRERALREAGYNVFLLRSEDVAIDLLTDSGTAAMSDVQWAAMMRGDEAYAGSRNFRELEAAVRDVLGYAHVIPVHQGRGAEHVLNAALSKKGDLVPGNRHFDTTKAHIEHAGAKAVDCTVPEADHPSKQDPFKGNVDLAKLRKVLAEHAPAGRVPYVVVTVTCNSAGGAPVSLANLREVRALTMEFRVPLILDIARFAENAMLLKAREPACARKGVPEIAREMAALSDGACMSGKKDALVNMGGFMAFHDRALYDKCAGYAVLFEGFLTYGGLSGRDIAAMAQGLRECVEEPYLRHRIGQVHHLARRLRDAGIPLYEPPGGHAVFIDGGAFLPHIPRERFPAQALVGELYLEGGVRAVEVGSVMEGRDPETGKHRFAGVELVRLAIPRRTYTREHLDAVADTVIRVWKRRDQVKGLAFDKEAPVLRHFMSTFRPLTS